MLGPVTFETGDVMAQPGTPRQRAVLGYLGLRAGEMVPMGRLIELLWGEEPPPTATKTVQAYLSRLRGATGLELPADGVGYRLDLGRSEVDAAVMSDELDRARQALAERLYEAADGHFTTALTLWRSMPLGELPDSALARSEAAHQHESFLSGSEDHHACRLALGHHVALVADLERFCDANPTRERSWAHLMVALYRSGRQADALRAYQRARAVLSSELGIDPGAELVQLEGRILRQEPDLDLVAPAGLAPRGGDDIGIAERVRADITVCGIPARRIVGRDAELADLHHWFDSGAGCGCASSRASPESGRQRWPRSSVGVSTGERWPSGAGHRPASPCRTSP